ncbi:alpha/beta hydrolase [Actinosynnema mirum]|uniref:TAP domain protein n=1 Tax=Actinosynnema mirum (strain ATCC 29888 / DSM 43827 / JCM 3225 / NBRC 14064 / NCIMB 13271 / NRRL B-12336 / IMRU 3971 / 101) TaxID=446462 RepID=C6W8X3_ACTMD|nr:alpha/beta hydrolase [Actinosynnema mirum]ACU37222.1 TAP domain protein [Actinosynnema mirum DSM 43827]
MRRTLSLAVVITALTAVVTPTASAAPDTSPPPVRWGPCEEPVPTILRCARVEVPLDYRDPRGRKIQIAISKLPSTNPERRRGVLLTNPGGPGGAGVAFPAVFPAARMPQEVLDSYDIIGFDPRGVGLSTPVTCDLTPEQQARGNFPPYARTDADVTREVGHARAIAAQCATSATADLLPHITTANTARDVDRVREALGERKISYLGYSYGTYLGAVHASLFPDRGDRFVLDSSLGPDGYDVKAMRRFALGLQDRFPDFAAHAAAHPEYGLGATPEQVTAKFFELAESLDARPVQGVDGTMFRGLTFGYLYSDADMPKLAEAWQALESGRPLPEDPPVEGAENLMAARFHVVCGDTRWPSSVTTYQRNAAVDRVRYPMLGGSTASVNPCAFWPGERVEGPVRITGRGPANVLISQNERDPGTPLAGAREMRQALGGRAVLVTADQGGHGAYLFGANKCANDAVTAFLARGERPSGDLACPAQPAR